VAVGEGHYLALTSDGRVWTWGDNATGQLGDGTTTGRDTPAAVPGLSGIVAIAAGGAGNLAGGMSLGHSLALKSDGTLWVWGSNAAGQLGDGTKTNRLSPVQVPGLSNVAGIAGGGLHSAAYLSDGSLWTWGNNQHGQLGDGSTIERLSPVQVPGLDGISFVTAGTSCTLTVAATTAAGGGPATGQPGADCNRDGVVNALDLQYVIDNFGRIVSADP
jgi:alpha-tubulin suppressor-like RCC1 family protein